LTPPSQRWSMNTYAPIRGLLGVRGRHVAIEGSLCLFGLGRHRTCDSWPSRPKRPCRLLRAARPPTLGKGLALVVTATLGSIGATSSRIPRRVVGAPVGFRSWGICRLCIGYRNCLLHCFVAARFVHRLIALLPSVCVGVAIRTFGIGCGRRRSAGQCGPPSNYSFKRTPFRRRLIQALGSHARHRAIHRSLRTRGSCVHRTASRVCRSARVWPICRIRHVGFAVSVGSAMASWRPIRLAAVARFRRSCGPLCGSVVCGFKATWRAGACGLRPRGSGFGRNLVSNIGRNSWRHLRCACRCVCCVRLLHDFPSVGSLTVRSTGRSPAARVRAGYLGR